MKLTYILFTTSFHSFHNIDSFHDKWCKHCIIFIVIPLYFRQCTILAFPQLEVKASKKNFWGLCIELPLTDISHFSHPSWMLHNIRLKGYQGYILQWKSNLWEVHSGTQTFPIFYQVFCIHTSMVMKICYKACSPVLGWAAMS